MAVLQTKVLKTSRGHRYPTPAGPQSTVTVTASRQEAFCLLPATEALHIPTAQTVPLFAPNLKASGCNLNCRPPVLPNTDLQSLSAGYLCIFPVFPTKESGYLITSSDGHLSPCVAWELGPPLPCTLLLSIKPTQSKALPGPAAGTRVGLGEI